MDREPLDSIEYESTYIEALRPEWERVTHTREAPNLSRHSVTTQVDLGVIASSVYAAANISIETPEIPSAPASSHNLAGQVVGRWRLQAVHPPSIRCR